MKVLTPCTRLEVDCVVRFRLSCSLARQSGETGTINTGSCTKSETDMSRLFVSYSYTARQGQTMYTGIENMIGGHLMFAPQDAEHIELIEEECAKHCERELGMDTAIAKIINWRVMDGT